MQDVVVIDNFGLPIANDVPDVGVIDKFGLPIYNDESDVGDIIFIDNFGPLIYTMRQMSELFTNPNCQSTYSGRQQLAE